MQHRISPGDARDELAEAAERVRRRVSSLHTSAQFAAVAECVLDVVPRRRGYAFDELAVVGGLVFARGDGDSEFRHFVGPADRVASDLFGIARHFALGPGEREFIAERLAAIPRYDA